MPQQEQDPAAMNESTSSSASFTDRTRFLNFKQTIRTKIVENNVDFLGLFRDLDISKHQYKGKCFIEEFIKILSDDLGIEFNDQQVKGIVNTYGDYRGLISYQKFYRSLDLEKAKTFLSDPSLLTDRLPQPYRTIVKVLEEYILDAAWEMIVERNELQSTNLLSSQADAEEAVAYCYHQDELTSASESIICSAACRNVTCYGTHDGKLLIQNELPDDTKEEKADFKLKTQIFEEMPVYNIHCSPLNDTQILIIANTVVFSQPADAPEPSGDEKDESPEAKEDQTSVLKFFLYRTTINELEAIDYIEELQLADQYVTAIRISTDNRFVAVTDGDHTVAVYSLQLRADASSDERDEDAAEAEAKEAVAVDLSQCLVYESRSAHAGGPVDVHFVSVPTLEDEALSLNIVDYATTLTTTHLVLCRCGQSTFIKVDLFSSKETLFYLHATVSSSALSGESLGNQRLLAVGSDDGAIVVFNLLSNSIKHTLNKHESRVTALCFLGAQDDACVVLASGSLHGHVHLYKLFDYLLEDDDDCRTDELSRAFRHSSGEIQRIVPVSGSPLCVIASRPFLDTEGGTRVAEEYTLSDAVVKVYDHSNAAVMCQLKPSPATDDKVARHTHAFGNGQVTSAPPFSDAIPLDLSVSYSRGCLSVTALSLQQVDAIQTSIRQQQQQQHVPPHGSVVRFPLRHMVDTVYPLVATSYDVIERQEGVSGDSDGIYSQLLWATSQRERSDQSVLDKAIERLIRHNSLGQPSTGYDATHSVFSFQTDRSPTNIQGMVNSASDLSMHDSLQAGFNQSTRSKKQHISAAASINLVPVESFNYSQIMAQQFELKRQDTKLLREAKQKQRQKDLLRRFQQQ